MPLALCLLATPGACVTGSAPPDGVVSKPATLMTSAPVGPAVRAALGGDWEANYFDAAVDLDGDGAEEIVVYVAGPMVCGTGGCTVFVFTPTAGGYELVGRISVAQLPVRLSPRSENGWRSLIVHVAGGGVGAPFDAEIAFDGNTYATNPTVTPAERVSDVSGMRTLIPTFESSRDGKPVPDRETD